MKLKLFCLLAVLALFPSGKILATGWEVSFGDEVKAQSWNEIHFVYRVGPEGLPNNSYLMLYPCLPNGQNGKKTILPELAIRQQKFPTLKRELIYILNTQQIRRKKNLLLSWKINR
ncbi:hypothetical protein HY797_01720 [Candidatus Falkowbacteria bacterium]|nr:hypothetical protein [Candidatus Falkowbacteria bacterium]